MALVILLLYVLIIHSNGEFYVNKCRDDWFNYKNEKCIKIIEYEINFAEAIEECHKLSSTLITIKSQEENSFITSLLYAIESQVEGVFIGLKRKKLNGKSLKKFEWVDKTELNFENWSPGEPNSLDNDNEECVEIYNTDISAGNWNDVGCGKNRFVICQQFINSTEIVFPFKKCENSQYVRYRDSCYRIYDNEVAKSWIQANEHCVEDDRNGRLLWIENSFEHSFIQYWTQLYMKSVEFWIGLHSNNESLILQYEWINEWPIYYTSWSSFSNKIISSKKHQCVNQNRDSGLWRINHDCDNRLAFICKINKQPIPGDESYINGFCPQFINKTSCDTEDVWLNLHKRSKYCYWFIDKQNDWSSSSKHCRSRDGTLVSIHSRDESEFLKPLMREKNQDIWIGLYQSTDGIYRWEDGSAMDTTNWFRERPCNDRQNDYCVLMLSRSMYWFDAKCNEYKSPFICQIKKVIPEGEETETSVVENLIKICKDENAITDALIKENTIIIVIMVVLSSVILILIILIVIICLRLRKANSKIVKFETDDLDLVVHDKFPHEFYESPYDDAILTTEIEVDVKPL